jgi:hypothetical protein
LELAVPYVAVFEQGATNMDETVVNTRTIPEMLREYNILAAQAAALGLAYRERKCFKDRRDAERSLDAVNSSLRAAKQAAKSRADDFEEDVKPAPEPVTIDEAGSDAPAASAADAAEKESPVASKTKAKTKRAPKAKAANGSGPRKGSTQEIMYKLLTRGKGCTRPEILKATGWKAVSVQQVCAALGLKIKMEKKKGEVTTYWGK